MTIKLSLTIKYYIIDMSLLNKPRKSYLSSLLFSCCGLVWLIRRRAGYGFFIIINNDITKKIIIIIIIYLDNKEGLNNTRIIKVNTVQRKFRIDFHSLPIISIASIPQ
jgi:hypothetical protein